MSRPSGISKNKGLVFLFQTTFAFFVLGNGLFGMGDVRHEGGIDGITAMRLVRVVEVDDEELGLHLIGIEVPQEMVVGDLREVWELVMRWILIVCSDLGRNRVGFLSMIKLPRAKSSYPFGTI